MDALQGDFEPHKQLRRAEQSSQSLAQQHSGSTTTTSSLNYVSAKSSLHSRQPSYHGEDAEQQEQVDSFAAWDRRLDPPYEGVHFHDISASRSFPSSTSLASPSTEDSPHELYAASETPFFAPPPPTAPYSAIPFASERSNHVPRTLSHARNRPVPLILASSNAQTIAADPPSNSDDPLPVKTPSTASTVQHVRIGSKPSARGFPYTSSILATSTSCAHLRGSHVLDHQTALSRARKRLSQASGGSGEDGSVKSHRSSSDVDLDLSFDLHEEENERSAMQDEQEKARWVGVDMQQVEPRDEEDSKGKNRVQSAVDIRAAYLAGEKKAAEATAASSSTSRAAPAVAILMVNDPTASTYASPPSNRSSWIRKPLADGGILPIATSSANPRLSRKNIPAPLEPTYKRLSTGRGYAFNPTDPISVPLPDSPDGPAPGSSTGALKSEWQGSSSSKSFPRPLNLIDRTRNLSLSSSAGSTSGSWTIGAIFAGGASKDKGKGKEVERGATPSNGGREEDLEYDSPRPNWADTTKESLRGGKGKLTRRTASDAVASPETSPLFESEAEGSSRTASTTPSDTPRFPDEHYHDDDEPVQATLGRSAKERKGRLDGLGLDFTGETVDKAKSLPSRPAQPSPTSRPGHVTIPSLSIIPPDDDDDDDSASVTSADSAADPTVSPSRRLSNRSSSSSHDRAAARVHYPPTTNDPPTRRLFGPAASHLLVSETMPRAQLPHQTSLASSRFSFTPAPLQLVRDQLLRATSSISVGGRAASPSPSAARPISRLSMASISAVVHTHPGTWLEETVPAKLAFLAGFILGPWCWIIGGWWLRHGDGELRSTSARRCREEGCNCGRLVQWYSVANSRRHARIAAGAKSTGAVDDEWAGLDQWVFLNRAAAVGSGSVVAALVAVAIWAAMTA